MVSFALPVGLLGPLLLFMVLACCLLAAGLVFLSPVPRPPLPEELHFTDVLTGELKAFSTLCLPWERCSEQQHEAEEQEGLSMARVSLSVIIPAFNETRRLPGMLDEALTHLEKRIEKDPSFSYEVLIVDDGSSDGTSRVAREYGRRFLVECKGLVSRRKVGGVERIRDFRVLTLTKNRGKGGAVTRVRSSHVEGMIDGWND